MLTYGKNRSPQWPFVHAAAYGSNFRVSARGTTVGDADPKTTTTRQRGQLQRLRATTAPSTVVMIMAPMTDAPYAPDSALDEPNATTKQTTAMNITAFAAGT